MFARHRVHLVAGERSAGGWDVPDWAKTAAASDTVVPGVGHMMMLEEPDRSAARSPGSPGCVAKVSEHSVATRVATEARFRPQLAVSRAAVPAEDET